MLARPPAGPWPELPLEPWRGTRDALHMWMQMIGKTLLAACPPQNHFWHCALRVSARGLANSAPLLTRDGPFDLELDLVDHVLVIRAAGRTFTMPLIARTVHAFYDEYRALLASAGLDVAFSTTPAEVPDPVPFERDDAPRPYDPSAAHRFWQVLRRADATLRQLTDEYVGKQSPVHFFWGSVDLAATRFSGRRAPARPGADPITSEAYSHEVVSFGFWPGGTLQSGATVNEPVFYAYAVPAPEGFASADVRPAAARWDEQLGEFLLPYEQVRTTPDPAAMVRAFCEDVYGAAASLGGWDRAALERGREPASETGAKPAGAHQDVHPLSP